MMTLRQLPAPIEALADHLSMTVSEVEEAFITDVAQDPLLGDTFALRMRLRVYPESHPYTHAFVIIDGKVVTEFTPGPWPPEWR
jgi:hypothetical protein